MEPNFPHFDSTSIIAPLNKKLQQTGQTENRTLNQLEIGFKTLEDENSRSTNIKKMYTVVSTIPFTISKSSYFHPKNY